MSEHQSDRAELELPQTELMGPAPAENAPKPSMLQQAASHIGGAAVQRKLAQRMVQRKAGNGAGGDAVHQAAERGVEGAGQQLPHLDKIQQSFGRHDVSGVSAHVGGKAADAANQIGAEAYATGSSAAFAKAPDLHTAAHEAAHVVQQRAGVHLKGGVGESGDTYERHADAVADAVVAGKSAEGLLDAHAGGGAAGGNRGSIQKLDKAEGGGAAPVAASSGGRATTKVNVNVREAASLKGAKLGILKAGSAVEVRANANGWLQIEYQGKTAFITANSQYVDFQAEPAKAPAQETHTAGGGAAAAVTAATPEGGGVLDGAIEAVENAASAVWDTVKSMFGGGASEGAKEGGTTGGQQGEKEQGGGEQKQGNDDAKKLAEMMAKDRLTPEEIATARELIGKLPAEEQAKYYLQLQAKTQYMNQRDNKQADEGKDGGTCNLTSLAMCLEYLGVPNPHPELQYDEALVKIANDNKFGALTAPATWEKTAAKLGIKTVSLFSGDRKLDRSFWEGTVRDQHLASGHSVLCSIVGHIVRVQAVTETGVVVDDPYGASKLKAGTGRGWGKLNKGKDGWSAANKENEGEDNAWPWEDVLAHTFRSAYAFQK